MKNLNLKIKNKNLFFIVAYNHENFLEKVVSRIPESIAQNEENEILIIDDGSKDNTFFIGEKIKAALNGKVRLTILKNPVNQGYGGNQKIGYRYAIDHGFEKVFLIHGDGQYAPEMMTELLKAYDETFAEAVFGTRMASFWSPLKGGMPLYKFIGNKTLTFLQNKILKTKMSEFHSGMRSYRTSLLKRIPFELNADDFHFDTEIIIQCSAAGAKIVEIPIPTHYGDEICHVNGWKYAWNILKSCLQFRIQQFGFLYDEKYDVDHVSPYPFKSSPYSIHSKIISKIPAGAKVLDVGCGRGHISKRLAAKGCFVDGVDMIPREMVDAGIKNYYQIDLAENLNEFEAVLAKEQYDYILLADIVEHLPSPEKFLKSLRQSLTCDGSRQPIVIASSGNVAFFIIRAMLMFGEFNYGPRGILDHTHKRLFTKRSFVHCFQQSGYNVLETNGVPIPATSILGEKSWIGLKIEWINTFLMKIAPGAFAYQNLVVSKPLPTVPQLLNRSLIYSDELRVQRKEISQESQNEESPVALRLNN